MVGIYSARPVGKFCELVPAARKENKISGSVCRINKGVYLCLFGHANTRKHVYEHSCSSVRVFLSILAHLAHLAQSFFSDFKCDK